MRLSIEDERFSNDPEYRQLCNRVMVLFNGKLQNACIEADEENHRITRYISPLRLLGLNEYIDFEVLYGDVKIIDPEKELLPI